MAIDHLVEVAKRNKLDWLPNAREPHGHMRYADGAMELRLQALLFAAQRKGFVMRHLPCPPSSDGRVACGVDTCLSGVRRGQERYRGSGQCRGDHSPSRSDRQSRASLRISQDPSSIQLELWSERPPCPHIAGSYANRR